MRQSGLDGREIHAAAALPRIISQRKYFEIHITHVKPVAACFAFERSASQRPLWVLDDMNGKLDTVYCVLVVATAVLVAIVKCTNCGSFKAR